MMNKPRRRGRHTMERPVVLTLLILLLRLSYDAAALEYDQGPCMQAAYTAAGGNGNLVCSAKDVTSNIIEWTGPTECIRGSFVYINVTASLTFKNTRYGKGFPFLCPCPLHFHSNPHHLSLSRTLYPLVVSNITRRWDLYISCIRWFHKTCYRWGFMCR